jgi:hypothetical protein
MYYRITSSQGNKPLYGDLCIAYPQKPAVGYLTTVPLQVDPVGTEISKAAAISKAAVTLPLCNFRIMEIKGCLDISLC